MTLQQALDLVAEIYERAKDKNYVHKPLAYALYQVWLAVDGKEGK